MWPKLSSFTRMNTLTAAAALKIYDLIPLYGAHAIS